MTAISLSTDPESRDNYGPYVPDVGAVWPAGSTANDAGTLTVRYNSVPDLERVLSLYGETTAAFIVEPIQGEAGVVVPDVSYLAEAHRLCRQHNVLLIADEIQTGIGRTGRMLCSEWSGVRPDMVTLGKALAGGMYPVSCLLTSRDVMLVVEPGTHGSTFGGNPLGCAVSIRALEVVEEEGLVEKADRLGEIFREGIRGLKSEVVKEIRGRGLLNAVVIDESKTAGRTAWDLCMLMKDMGLLVSFTCHCGFIFCMSISIYCFLRLSRAEDMFSSARHDVQPETHRPSTTCGLGSADLELSGRGGPWRVLPGDTSRRPRSSLDSRTGKCHCWIVGSIGSRHGT